MHWSIQTILQEVGSNYFFAFQTKDAKDRDMILPHLGKSEKSMVNMVPISARDGIQTLPGAHPEDLRHCEAGL
jgi:hypothetical protein